MKISPFLERYRRALGDEQLQRTLLTTQRYWRAGRDEAIAALDWPGDRARLTAVRSDVVANMAAYLDRFEAGAAARGARVVRAATADEATRYIVGLARAHHAGRVVKSKSMVSEEIGLNDRLADAGVRVVETDLGEWIVQLAGERPSHMVTPALHKNRRQVAELFERVTGRPVSREDIGNQVRVAQAALREEFLAAEIGISGANALLADSGTVVLVTNEGNAELVTSVPPIHVVVAGIEKVMPDLAAAAAELRLLGPSATAQRTTSYVSFISGPSDGQELHIILLDNGRTAMRASPLFDETLRCIRCGACSYICPPFGVVGGHVFGYVYSGAIGLVNTPFHHGLEHDVGPQGLCVSCNACQTVCPVDIPLPRQILDTRAEVVERYGLPVWQRMALEIWSRPAIFRLAARTGSVLQKPIQRGHFVNLPALSKQTSWRKPPALASRPFRERTWQGHSSPLDGDLGRALEGRTIAYFVQCLTDWLYPEMGRAIVEILTSLGARVIFPREQHCCGLPALDAGTEGIARRMARQTIATLEQTGADYIVSGATSCVVAIRHDYPHLFRDDPAWQERAARVGARVFDLTRFLHSEARLPSGSLSGPPARATYHYFCQSYNVLGIRHEPLELLADVCGLELRPLPEANVCCGFGGSVSINHPEVCSHILDRKLANIETAGSPLVVTDNPGCIMHLKGGVAARGGSIRVAHTAEIIAEHIREVRRQADV